MVPGHCHVLSPRYWRDVQALPENWFGVPFVVDSVEVKFDEDALATIGPALESLGIHIDTIYTTRWLELPAKRDRILALRNSDLAELVQVICSPE
jgi:hypothetical protein